MYKIFETKRFKKSYRRLQSSGTVSTQTKARLAEIIDTLAAGKTLASSFRDHALKGALSGYRECHIRGDLLMVYTFIEEKLVLVLVDVGSHSYLNL